MVPVCATLVTGDIDFLCVGCVFCVRVCFADCVVISAFAADGETPLRFVSILLYVWEALSPFVEAPLATFKLCTCISIFLCSRERRAVIVAISFLLLMELFIR